MSVPVDPGADATRARVRRASLVMAAGTVLSRATGFGRVLALAYAAGFFRLADTYNIANTTPNIVYELVLGGVLSATLVPLFVERLAVDDDESWEAVSAIVGVAVVALAVLTAVVAIGAPLIVHLYTFRVSGSTGRDQQAVATTLLRLFAPQILFYGLITLSTALLHARRRFAATSLTPVLNNLVVIGVLVSLPHVMRTTTLAALRHDVGAQLLLGLGTTAGVLVQAVALLPSLRAAGTRLRVRWHPGHPAVRRLLALSGWTIGFVVANQVALWAVLALANGENGGVSVYQSAYMFFLLPHAVIAVSLMTALLPELAERWSARDRDGYRRHLVDGLRVDLFLLVPAAIGYVVLASHLGDVARANGYGSSSSAVRLFHVLPAFAVGLPGFSAYLLLMRAYQAMQDTRSMFLLYCVENAVNIALAVALFAADGVRGLAFAYSVAYTVATVVSLAHLRRRVGAIDARPLLATVARAGVASAVMAVVLVVVAGGGRTSEVTAGVRTALAVALGAGAYLLTARALRAPELSTVRPRRRAIT
jgi:putative peptidoglycan lipid II flippase